MVISLYSPLIACISAILSTPVLRAGFGGGGGGGGEVFSTLPCAEDLLRIPIPRRGFDEAPCEW